MITDEDIKVGQKYKLELLCIHSGEKVIIFETPTGDHIPLRNGDRECVTSINPYEPLKLVISNRIPETAPKYDPCRKFRKGDIVEPRKGREVYACEWFDCVFHKLEGTYKVCDDEREGHVSVIDKETGEDCYVSSFALELVTPVEERESYSVKESIFIKDEWQVWKDGGDKTQTLIATYTLAHPNAKKAAAAERDRLNAEYRKEQGND
jgi:hypothetical protein